MVLLVKSPLRVAIATTDEEAAESAEDGYFCIMEPQGHVDCTGKQTWSSKPMDMVTPR